MQSERKVRLPVLQKGVPAPLDLPLTLPVAPAPTAATAPDDRPLGERSYRTSSYTIYVDLPGNAEEMLLVHAYTGAYDRVSRRVATYVRSLEPRHAPRPLYGTWSPEPTAEAGGPVTPPSPEALQRLQRRGYLTRKTPAEEEVFFSRIAATLHHVAVRQRPGYILMPTYQCNLRCAYCFQDHMRTDPAYSHLLRVMSREMVDRVFRGMEHIEAAHGLEPGGPRSITLFGGEPLLAESRPVIEYIIGKARAAGEAQFSAISNGTDLDAYEDLLGPEGISAIQITLDGPPDEHDQRRIYADGSGSFERIARNVTLALSRGVAISVRMNIDRNNIGLLPRLAEEFVGRGWTEQPRFSTYVAAIHAANDNVSEKTTLDSWELGEALKELQASHPVIRHIGTQDDNMLEQARQIFDQRQDPLPRFKTSFCGAHTTMYVIDAFGDIYACWERTGDPSMRIGAIADSGEVRMSSGLLNMWRSRDVTTNQVCRKCRYATYCGGGCAVLAEEQHGTVFSNHCDGFAKRFRKSVASAYLEHASGVRAERKAQRICDM